MHIHTTTPIRTAFLLLCIFIVTLLAGMGIGNSIVHGSLRADVSTSSTATIRAKLRQERLEKAKKRRAVPASTRRFIRKGVPLKTIVRPVRTRRSTGAVLREAAPPRLPIKAGCGDKLVLFEETCDDGNALGNDGCSAVCAVEQGYVCSGSQPSFCWSVCGDGAVAYDEKCDDGNTDGGDGCSGRCRVEILYRCTGSPSVCEIPVICGDNNKEGTETCDDGNVVSGDGCSSSCALE